MKEGIEMENPIDIPSVGVCSQTEDGRYIGIIYYCATDIVKISLGDDYALEFGRGSLSQYIKNTEGHIIIMTSYDKMEIKEEVLNVFLFYARWHRLKYLRTKYNRTALA